MRTRIGRKFWRLTDSLRLMHSAAIVWISVVYFFLALLLAEKMTLSLTRKRLLSDFKSDLKKTTDKSIAEHALKLIGDYGLVLFSSATNA